MKIFTIVKRVYGYKDIASIEFDPSFRETWVKVSVNKESVWTEIDNLSEMDRLMTLIALYDGAIDALLSGVTPDKIRYYDKSAIYRRLNRQKTHKELALLECIIPSLRWGHAQVKLRKRRPRVQKRPRRKFED